MADFDFSKYKVLLCDPDPEDIEIVRDTYLEQSVGDFVATPSPNEALRQIPQMKPDLILMALDFPDISGIQVIQKIRALNDGEFYKTPILMLLNKVSQNLLREACRAGIEGAIRKPVQPAKVLRFSRAVILKPRRFICVRHYFGPERRGHQDPHYNGQERRDGFRANELTTDEFTRSRRPAAGGGTAAGVVLNSGGTSQARPSAGVIDYNSDEFKKPKQKETVMDMSDGALTGSKSVGSMAAGDLVGGGSKTKSTDNSIEVASTSSKKTNSAEIDFTSQDKPKSNGDFDFGVSKDRAKSDSGDIEVATSKDKKKKPSKTEDAPVEAAPKKEEKIETKETEAKPEETYEEVIDLEECLELHKEWINSGGKLGQQANRPNSDFRGQELEDADFTRSTLPKSNFDDVNCTNTVFRKSDLRGCSFRKAKLTSADLRVTLLRQADLRDARLDKANMLGADLSGANLQGAVLRGVNMSGANLNRTNLRGVNLVSVQGLIPEQIKRAITDNTTRLPFNT